MITRLFKRTKVAKVVADTAQYPPHILRAGFDIANTNDANRRHWSFADSLSADAVASPLVRKNIRDRARYEVANNSYARGITLTLANDTVGTGPRLQVLTDDETLNALIEDLFMHWCKAVSLPDKLRTMRISRAESGEVFCILAVNPAINSPVKLDIQLIEADRVTEPAAFMDKINARMVDGILFDEFDNPTQYIILRRHPGDFGVGMSFSASGEFDIVNAENVIHYYRVDRPGQSRGIPDITPALPLFGQLRRYTLAVLGAAETAANFAGVLVTDAPADGDAEDIEALDSIELEPRALLTMPSGWRMEQVKPEQPSTTYPEFKREILNEIARCLNMPFNVAAGNSSGYNFASGKLDHQVYYKSLRVEQECIARVVLDKLFASFLREAVLISDLLPLSMRTHIATLNGALPHQWFWDGQSEVDPVKEANAQAIRLKNHSTTLADEYAKRGQDWETAIRQRAKEKALLDELGLTEENAAFMPDDTESEDA